MSIFSALGITKPVSSLSRVFPARLCYSFYSVQDRYPAMRIRHSNFMDIFAFLQSTRIRCLLRWQQRALRLGKVSLLSYCRSWQLEKYVVRSDAGFQARVNFPESCQYRSMILTLTTSDSLICGADAQLNSNMSFTLRQEILQLGNCIKGVDDYVLSCIPHWRHPPDLAILTIDSRS